jgi:hypothetical protein
VQTVLESRKSAWLAVAFFYAALTLLYAWPLLLSFGSRLPSDIGDPGLNAWILWWDAHVLPLTDRWWNAPIFFPVKGAFALSETLLGLAPITTPLQWLGVSPVGAYNVAFLLSYFSAALAAHALAWQLTRSHGAALIAGTAYGFNPYRAAQLPHLQTLMSCWMPLALFALHRYLDRRRRRDLALAGVAWMLNGLTTGYFLLFFAVLAACWVLWFVRTWRDLLAIAATLGIASLALAPLLAGYLRHQAAFGISRGIGEITFFSADVSAIWAESRFVWLSHHWTIAPRAEGELYPGIVILALVATGAAVAWRRRARGPASQREGAGRRRTRRALLAMSLLVGLVAMLSWISGGWSVSLAGLPLSTNHPFKTLTTATWLLVFSLLLHPRLQAAWRRRSTPLFYGLAAGVMFVMALGPLPHAFGAPIFYQAPYAWLMALPGGNALRVPARFAMLMILCLSQAAALALVRVAGQRPARFLAAALVLGVALDGWVPALKTDPTPDPIDLSGFDRAIPVLELPMEDLYSDTTAMLRATVHGHPLVNGYSGYLPPRYEALQQEMQDFSPDALRGLRTSGPLLVVINHARDREGKSRAFVAAAPGAALVRETPAVLIYSLPAISSGR